MFMFIRCIFMISIIVVFFAATASFLTNDAVTADMKLEHRSYLERTDMRTYPSTHDYSIESHPSTSPNSVCI